jgi:hypothetical protein
MEAEALFARLVELARQIRAEVPRADHATAEGARAISRARLAAQHANVAGAVELLRLALADARPTGHPDPDLAVLAGIADRLDAHANVLAAEHKAEVERLRDALGMNWDRTPTKAS